MANQLDVCFLGVFMKEIKVLGSGCKKCVKAAELIQTVASSCDAAVHIIQEHNPEVMLEYGVMSTPAVVIDKQLVHSGSIPSIDKIELWLKQY